MINQRTLAGFHDLSPCLAEHAASESSLIAAEKWLYRFTPDDIAEIETAYTHFKSLDLPFNAINHTTFPIPTGSGLFKALKDAEQKVKYGLGLTVLRGLPVREWERTKQIAIFAGVSSYIGAQRIKQGKQNIVHLRYVSARRDRRSLTILTSRDITNLDVDKRPAISELPIDTMFRPVLMSSCQGPDQRQPR